MLVLAYVALFVTAQKHAFAVCCNACSFHLSCHALPMILAPFGWMEFSLRGVQMPI